MSSAQNDPQVDFEPIGCRVRCSPGTTVMDAARAAGLPLTSVCGGAGTCGQCLVRVVAGAVSELTPVEVLELDAAQISQGMRLACHARILGDMKVDIPLASRTVAQRLELTGAGPVDVPFAPTVREHLAVVTPPSVHDPRADFSLLADALDATGDIRVCSADHAALRQLPGLLRGHGWRVRASRRGAEVVDVRPPDRHPLGLAVDIGTTKIAAHLVDMESGATLAIDGITNPQIAYGEDVMSRITYTMREPRHRLTEVLVEGINGLIRSLCDEPERIVDAVAVGNTAMHHLFAGLPVRQLGLAPYNAVVSDPIDVKARDLGLHLAPGAYVHLLPNVAGFIGADHVAMILATGLDQADGTYIGLDIGTNTEVVLARRGELLSCSTASGPAFEGAHIKHGLRAVEGAIDGVHLRNGGVEVRTIGNAPAIGICGSGVLDAVDELRRAGVLNRRGRLLPHPLVIEQDGERAFLLVGAAESGTCSDITLSEKDISEILLAKAAMRTGIDTLLQETGMGPQDLDGIVIAGAFGTHIDVRSAVGIGMLPTLPLEHIRQVGNAAGVGARLALISEPHRQRALAIARRLRYLELMVQPDFGRQFGRAMFLPSA